MFSTSNGVEFSAFVENGPEKDDTGWFMELESALVHSAKMLFCPFSSEFCRCKCRPLEIISRSCIGHAYIIMNMANSNATSRALPLPCTVCGRARIPIGESNQANQDDGNKDDRENVPL